MFDITRTLGKRQVYNNLIKMNEILFQFKIFHIQYLHQKLENHYLRQL